MRTTCKACWPGRNTCIYPSDYCHTHYSPSPLPQIYKAKISFFCMFYSALDHYIRMFPLFEFSMMDVEHHIKMVKKQDREVVFITTLHKLSCVIL